MDFQELKAVKLSLEMINSKLIFVFHFQMKNHYSEENFNPYETNYEEAGSLKSGK